MATAFVNGGWEASAVNELPAHHVPQATTVPSARKASVWAGPAEIAITLLSPGGTLVCPCKLSPQATTVPSPLSATLKSSPPATATALVRLGGGLHWPWELSPHATM